MSQASLLQVKRGRNGRLVQIERDVLDVVQRIKEISPRLSVDYNDGGGYFRVIEHCDDDRERLVTTCTELDNRVVERIREISNPGYDFVAEVERLDNEAEKRKQHEFAEEVGEKGERLAHALRKDLEVKSSIVLPRGLA